MFDTGAHMMNTICLLADADCEQVSALMNNRGRGVDVICAVAGRFQHTARRFVSCGSQRYPLKTRVVCDQALEKQSAPISFMYKDREVKVCSEEDRAEFDKEPNRYIEKIKEVKAL